MDKHKTKETEMIARRIARMLAFAAVSSFAGTVYAQAYPTKPVRFMVGFPAGAGSSDVSARAIAAKLSERLGQPVIVDNRSGAGGIVGVDAIAKAPPDGYTIGFGGTGSLAVSPTLLPNMPYDSLKDLAPLTLSTILPQLVVVRADLPVQSMNELVTYARARPGQVTFGTSGTGTAQHLAGAMINLIAGVDLAHVPYKGSLPAVTDLIGGQIPLAIIDLATVRSFIKAGRIRVLGMTSAKRTILAPEIPTVAESGVPGVDAPTWFGILTTAGTPPEIIAKLNSELVATLKNIDVRDKLMAAGIEPMSSTPEEFATLIRTDLERYARLIKSSGIKVQ